MKWLKAVVPLYLASTLMGCAVYMGATTASQISTGKSIPELAVSTVADADCSLWDLIVDNEHHKYYCETRDISKTYNRNTF